MIFRISPSKIDQWGQYPNLIRAHNFFEMLGKLDLTTLIPVGTQHSILYYDWSFGKFSMNDRETYKIDEGKVEPFRTEGPVDSNWFMVKSTVMVNDYSTDHDRYYLFNVRLSE